MTRVQAAVAHARLEADYAAAGIDDGPRLPAGARCPDCGAPAKARCYGWIDRN